MLGVSRAQPRRAMQRIQGTRPIVIDLVHCTQSVLSSGAWPCWAPCCAHFLLINTLLQSVFHTQEPGIHFRYVKQEVEQKTQGKYLLVHNPVDMLQSTSANSVQPRSPHLTFSVTGLIIP